MAFAISDVALEWENKNKKKQQDMQGLLRRNDSSFNYNRYKRM